ncbi:hypothetical protein BJA5080_07964 [Bradyrhizobium diazoefficiens SEMIA 5080]|uniref:Uncharacterized protein n=1 Tax=Bradyrhizobium diazoefficiens SEMIA 5080 TaxID=754504 RepID=A0A837CQG0_9BRAD|nr:hypothetical protein BJA5080_07964 [Bradyrhizobium diazoefficiens SEMIA 5080]
MRRSRAAEFSDRDAELLRLVAQIVLNSRARDMHHANRQLVEHRFPLSGLQRRQSMPPRQPFQRSLQVVPTHQDGGVRIIYGSVELLSSCS